MGAPVIIPWKVGVRISVDPDMTRDYQYDLTDWLEGVALAYPATTLTPTNCTAAITSSGTSIVKVRVSGVLANAAMTLHAVTTAGEVDDFTVGFDPEQH